jgi:hypothetical protein
MALDSPSQPGREFELSGRANGTGALAVSDPQDLASGDRRSASLMASDGPAFTIPKG